MGLEPEDRRQLLLVGDVEGGLAKLYSQVATQQKKGINFTALFAVGAFLPALGDTEAAAVLAEFVSGTRKVPIDTFFIDSRSAAFLQAAPDGKQLTEKIHFLGGFGVREFNGLKVAYLSGCYDAATFAKPVRTSDIVEEDGPCFVGAAYTATAVQKLIKLAKAEASPIDILLTAEWPKGMEERMDESAKPKDPDGQEIEWSKISSPAIAELCDALEPRYHIFGGADLYYQRAPFQTKDGGHVCRCIALGRVASKGKARSAFHGLSLSPAATMPETVLKQRPANTTPNPFVTVTAPSERESTKRDASAMEEPEEDPIEPDTVFLGRLPANIEEKRIQAALKHVGKIERVHLAREAGEGSPCKGFGWVTFSTPEEAEAACDLDGMLDCGGRMITISISRPKNRDGGPRKKKREIQIVVEPHADCWFCLVNPKVEKHMIVTATTEVYIATARGPVNPYHVQILPVKHAPCFAACPPELQQALQVQLAALRKMFEDAGQECLVWERWIPMGSSSANHMQVQVLPIDKARAGNDARAALEAAAKQHLSGAKFKKLSAHTEVADNLNDDPTTPYIYFEIPGDLTAKGRQIERFLYAAVPGAGPRIPIDFGRQVACQLLGCDDKVDWRQCQDSKEGEKKLAVTLRELFKPFQVKGKPKPKSG